MYKSWYVFQYDGQKSESEIKLHAFLSRQILSEEQIFFFYKNTQTVTLITHLNWKNFPQKNFNQSLYSNSEIQESFS